MNADAVAFWGTVVIAVLDAIIGSCYLYSGRMSLAITWFAYAAACVGLSMVGLGK